MKDLSTLELDYRATENTKRRATLKEHIGDLQRALAVAKASYRQLERERNVIWTVAETRR